MAIKGKSKSRSRRVVAIPPRPPVYVRKPPIWRRRIFWAIVAALVVIGAVTVTTISLKNKHRRDLKQKAIAAVNSFATQIQSKFPPAPDSQAQPPTGYLIYPSVSKDLDDVATGKTSAADAEEKGKSLTSSAKASADAIKALNVFKIIPEDADYGPTKSVSGQGATRLEAQEGRNRIVHAFTVYETVGALMTQAGQTTDKAARKAIVDDAKQLVSEANSLFQEGYQKLINLKQELGILTQTPFNPGPALGGG